MSDVADFAESIPYFGTPSRDLSRSQRRERSSALNALSPADRERYNREVGRMFAMRQHGATRRTDARFLDPEAERYAVAELRAHGLDLDVKGEPLNGERLRRRAKAWLLAQADALAESARTPTDDEVMIAFHEKESIRWREVARLDRARARQHEAQATAHESALVELMRKTGLS